MAKNNAEFRKDYSAMKHRLEFYEKIIDNVPVAIYQHFASNNKGEYVLVDERYSAESLYNTGFDDAGINEMKDEFARKLLHEKVFTEIPQLYDRYCRDKHEGKAFVRKYSIKLKNATEVAVIGFCRVLQHIPGETLWPLMNCVFPITKEITANPFMPELLLEYKRLDCENNKRKLSPKELEVVILIGNGHTAGTAALEMKVGECTIVEHKSRIMTKLGLPNFIAVISWAIECGIIKKQPTHPRNPPNKHI